ncbi:putative mitochondrial DNA polymerase gamma homologue [Acaryochloris phage A-HIS1]|nr:DNA polymerase gamma [Acaryochloris phage A-HIS1]CBA17726.1 putative mitochondrial DNA polymerase gamma homologue [Acaryochloris phage A-HIS1]
MPKEFYRNIVGLPMIPTALHEKLFYERPTVKRTVLGSVTSALREHGYEIPLDVPKNTPNVAPIIPDLLADTIEEHFELMADHVLGDFEKLLDNFRKADQPSPPTDFIISPRWTRYPHNGETPMSVDYPYETVNVFDTETFVKAGSFPIMAATVTASAWYIWLHPCLCSDAVKTFEPEMISFGFGKIIIGHNISYDRIRILEEYTNVNTRNRFLCTMSMHTCVAGLSAEQRDTYAMFSKRRNRPAWYSAGSPKNLIDCYNFHLFGDVNSKHPNAAKKSDKKTRDIFVEAVSHKAIKRQLHECVSYMLTDVYRTLLLTKALYPKYRLSCPSKVTLAAALLMGSSILTAHPQWESWAHRTDLLHSQITKEIEDSLNEIAAVELSKFERDPESVTSNVWLSNLDWTPAKTGKNKGLPLWWRKAKKRVSAKSKIAPYLLRLRWNDVPMIHIRNAGWCIPIENLNAGEGLREIELVEKRTIDEKEAKKKGYRQILRTTTDSAKNGWYAQIPHKKGGENNVGSPLAKDYIFSFENGSMTGSETAVEVLKKAASISFWTSTRKRVFKQIARVSTDGDLVIVPDLQVNGAGTRRPVDPTFLAATSSKATKLGSELKAMIIPPRGSVFVSADFNSQEMTIAGRMADSRAGVLGGTPVGCLVQTGNKADGTDAHSQLMKYLNASLIERRGKEHETVVWRHKKNGNIVYQKPKNGKKYDLEWSSSDRGSKDEYYITLLDAITRQESKQPNFAILYGSGKKGLTGTFKKERIEWAESECAFLAAKSLELRKGSKAKVGRARIWVGGTDSEAFNYMEAFANAPIPRTPTLNAAISTALRPNVVGRDYMPSRCNSAIQGSGQDVSHANIVAYAYYCDVYNVNARFTYLIHDEIISIAPHNEALRASQCLNLGHLQTWALVSSRLNLGDVPANSAWFPGTNIDLVMRKEVKIANVTPSWKEPELPNGLEIDHTHMFEDGKFFLSSVKESERFAKENLRDIVEYHEKRYN